MSKYNNNEENIRLAAYYIWEQLGRPWGKEDECWQKACEQLMVYDTKTTSKTTSKCSTTKKTSTKSKATVMSSTTTSSKTSPKAKTNFKAHTPSTAKVNAAIDAFHNLKANASALRSKVSLNTNTTNSTNTRNKKPLI